MDVVRLITHWSQAKQVADGAPVRGSVLEIGPGNGHTTWLMRQWGMDVTTLDLDPALNPDLVGDVIAIPCSDDSYDCVLAAEVLEHLPWEEFGPALQELRRVSRNRVVLTLPAPFLGLSLLGQFTNLGSHGLHLGVPHWKRHRFDGQHYWEVGKRGTERRVVRRVIREQGFTILREFRPAPSLYCLFFILQV